MAAVHRKPGVGSHVSGASILRKASRLCGWLLAPLMLLQFLSGYAILHPRIFGGLIGKATAFKLHGVIQPATAAAVMLHGLPMLRRVLRRWGLGGIVVDIFLVLVGAGLFAFAAYLAIRG